jgi:hypothetical protein
LAVVVFLLALPVNGEAATTVKGKLVRGTGMTVLGVSRDGSAVADRVGDNYHFKLRFKGRSARNASLQLIARRGSYAGPIVLARKRRRAYTFLAGSGEAVKLGRVPRRGGYAITRRAVSTRLLESGAVNRRGSARANKRGKPIGAGKLGLVKTSGGGGAAQLELPRPGEDTDADGLPSVVDADDNGNGIIDQSDPEAPPESGIRGTIFSTLPLEPEQAVNANASGVTAAQLDATVEAHLRLGYIFFPRDPFTGEDLLPGRTVKAVDVDCFELAYCKAGAGTAVIPGDTLGSGTADPPAPDSLWTDYDPNGDGLPNLPFTDDLAGGGQGGYHLVVQPRADTGQIRPGDTYNFLIRTDGAPVAVPVTLSAYFVTAPAIASYDDGSGAKAVRYPVQPGDPGTSESPAPLSSERVRLTWWRPQRPGIPGAERADLIDMGGLVYGADVSVRVGDEERVVECTADDWSAPSDALTVEQGPGPPGAQALTDSATDRPPSAANTLSATLDLGSCLRRDGVDPAGKIALTRIVATARTQDGAAQFFHMKLPG